MSEEQIKQSMLEWYAPLADESEAQVMYMGYLYANEKMYTEAEVLGMMKVLKVWCKDYAEDILAEYLDSANTPEEKGYQEGIYRGLTVIKDILQIDLKKFLTK